MTIRCVKRDDFTDLAIIYKSLYDNIDLGESWSIENAYRLCDYWYEKQRDLFFVAEEQGKAVGAIMAGVKPWFDGNRLVDIELFVSEAFQHRHIAKELFKKLLFEAQEKYNCSVIEFHTYGDKKAFPQNWYRRIGCEQDERLIIMNGDIPNVLNYIG